jgi:dinuclear metal center YbgI/SA1388 family protein
MVRTEELAAYLDEYLRIGEIGDAPNALNGLQVMNAGEVTRVAAAVDASQASIEAAAQAGADLLLVHHGLFWDGPGPLTGRRYRRIRRVLDAGMAVYSAHLPLDVHAEVGNAAVLARELGIRCTGQFGIWEGVTLGVSGELETDRDALADQLGELLGDGIRVLPGGPERIRTVGVITGGGGSMIADAVAAGLDAYVTGEGAHHTYFDAMENGINVYYAGHYATETWGVRALASHLEERFDLPWAFVDQPTGL